MKHTLIILFLSIISTLNIFAQNISVDASIDTNAILIGDQLKLNLQLTKPANKQVLFPQLSDTITDKIEIIQEAPIDTVSNKNGIITLNKQYTITSFDSGYYHIPPLAFTIVNKDSDTITTNPLPLVVYTVKVDTASHKIADIKAPYETPLTFNEFIHEFGLYILIAIAILALLILAYWYYRKTKKKNAELDKSPKKPREPAHIIALRKLDELKDKKLWQNNNVKEYYSELTDILREYLVYRYNIDAMEMTSSEILSAIRNLNEVTDEVFNKMRYLLTTADFVKFAKAKPLPDEHDTCLKNAYFFVEETKPKEVNKEQKTETENSENLNNTNDVQ